MFRHRLALALGIMDVDDLLLLPERKLNNWRLFDVQEPIGPRESRKQLALLCANIANRWRPKGAPAKDLEDFLLQSAADQQKRQFDKIIGSLASVATPRPSGFKRKRPPGHSSKDKRK